MQNLPNNTRNNAGQAREALCAVLGRHVDGGRDFQSDCTRDQLVDALRWGGHGTTKPTVCRWINGQLEPSYSEFASLLAYGPRALVDDLLQLQATLARRVAEFPADLTDEELDVNQDGRVDPADLVAATASRLGHVQQTATEEAIDAAGDRLITPEESAMLLGNTNQGSRMCAIIRGILAKCTARPLFRH